MRNKNEIILYQSDEPAEHIEARFEDEKVWLSQSQMATLFGQTKQNLSLHINNCYREGELEKQATVKEFLTVQNEGELKPDASVAKNATVQMEAGREVKSEIEYYNLDAMVEMILNNLQKNGKL